MICYTSSYTYDQKIMFKLEETKWVKEERKNKITITNSHENDIKVTYDNGFYQFVSIL